MLADACANAEISVNPVGGGLCHPSAAARRRLDANRVAKRPQQQPNQQNGKIINIIGLTLSQFILNLVQYDILETTEEFYGGV